MGCVKRTLILFLNFALICVLIDKRKPITGMGCLEFVMSRICLGLAFFFQTVALIAYIFLFDVLTYISVFTLWLGAILFGFHIKELLPDSKK